MNRPRLLDLFCGAGGAAVGYHRFPLMQPECPHAHQAEVWGVYGDHGDKTPVTRPNGTSRGNKARDAAHAREVMGIDWMTRWDDLADAIPPPYTEYIGRRLIREIRGEAA